MIAMAGLYRAQGSRASSSHHTGMTPRSENSSFPLKRTQGNNRARFLAAVSAGYATFSTHRFPAGAAEFAYKLAITSPKTAPQALGCIAAADAVLRDSGGRFEIKVFPGGVLGSPTDLLAQIRLGAIDFLLPPYVDLAN